jgi:hypothetical protein
LLVTEGEDPAGALLALAAVGALDGDCAIAA